MNDPSLVNASQESWLSAVSAKVFSPAQADRQAPLHEACLTTPTLGVVVGSLAVGGAEKIVLDWILQNRTRFRIRLFVIHHQPVEWPLPVGVSVVRPRSGSGQGAAPDVTLRAAGITAALIQFAQELAADACALGRGVPRVLCHMTRREHRDALERGGAHALAVLHNAMQGWKEPFGALRADRRLVAVSQACIDDLKSLGRDRDVALVRHVPSSAGRGSAGGHDRASLRRRLCDTLGLPDRPGAKLIAMIGAVKPQKNYGRAIDILERLRGDDAFLVIFGGPIGVPPGRRTDGAPSEALACWLDLCAAVRRGGLQDRVRLPGFVPDAGQYLPAFDVLLNTSFFEGLSMATLEALLALVPVVATRVGGQGELASDGLWLLDAQACPEHWAESIRVAWSSVPTRPAWAGFPAHRLWTLEQLVSDYAPTDHLLFVTANLNAGGAQRSLVNLACCLHRELPLEVAVTGSSSSCALLDELQAAGVCVSRSGDTRDCFDHAQTLLGIAAASRSRVLCFWNVDPKIKLLLSKCLPEAVRLIDVSPGGYAFEELDATRQFQALIGFSQEQYYNRLSHLVLKYDAVLPQALPCPVSVVRNGVPLARGLQQTLPAQDGRVRIVVNGRIAPTKFLLEVLQAMQLVWPQHPDAELHLVGVAEQRHQAYAHQVLQAAWDLQQQADDVHGRTPSQRRIHVHGPRHSLQGVARPADVAVVLGQNQGCPNAVLEAMAAGLAVVSNDSGGTAEIVRDGYTGVLLTTTAPAALANALDSLLRDSQLRLRLGRAGRRHVESEFSMLAMVQGYRNVFGQLLKEGEP